MAEETKKAAIRFADNRMAAPLGIKLPDVSHYQKNTDEAGRFACINTCRILFFAYAYSGLIWRASAASS